MVLRAISTGTSVLVSMLYASGLFKAAPNATTAYATTGPPIPGIGGSQMQPNFGLSEAQFEDQAVCNWWTPDVGRDTEHTCGAGSLRMALSRGVHDALHRAERCARATGVRCILSTEVGLELPSVFVWDVQRSHMRALLIPQRDLAYEAVQTNVRIRVGHPLDTMAVAGDPYAAEFAVSKSVFVEYVDGRTGSVKMTREVFNESDAYCIQLLNESVSEQCLEELQQ